MNFERERVREQEGGGRLSEAEGERENLKQTPCPPRSWMWGWIPQP